MKKLSLSLLFLLGAVGIAAAQPSPTPSPFGSAVSWDSHSLIIDGRRVCPVMGEIHYSRVPADEWPAEVRKMRDGGVTIIATYVFWNHIEEEEGIFCWDGQRDLRRFLEVCKAEGMPVVLRMGPWCHGEVRNGGLPEWLFAKGCKMRSLDSTFMAATTRLYRQIFTQVQGLQWKDGGPVIAAQFDNEFGGAPEYLMALKRTALAIGFDLPFYTRTAWPRPDMAIPFGEMIPLYGDYADGFWDKSTQEGAGSYYKAFNFSNPLQTGVDAEAMGLVGNEELRMKNEESSFARNEELRMTNDEYKLPASSESEGKPYSSFRAEGAILHSSFGGEADHSSFPTYPYFTCELGGGMATSYHRRPYLYPEDAYSMALVKLGSGSNLLGYYMYHGGTNPEGHLHTLNECQTSPGTANNDLPVCTYDFQAPLGEFGQTYPQYYGLRPLHLFMQDFGEELAPMTAHFPGPKELQRGEDPSLRWAVRTDGQSAFLFVNNYERLQTLSTKKDVRLEACGIKLPRLTIPSGTMAIFPVNIAGLRYATAQLVARRDGKTYLMQVPGIPVTIALSDGKTLRNVKPQGAEKPVCQSYYLLTRQQAEHLFLTEESERVDVAQPVRCEKVKEAGTLRVITKGRAKVAAAPTEEDWEQAAVYRLSTTTLPSHDALLSITYRGDCARLYALTTDAEGRTARRLVADNFYYGRPFLYGLWRLPEGSTGLELRILPLQPEAPIYLPREAAHTAGEAVVNVEVM